MFFMFFLTSAFYSEYLVSLLLRGCMILFLGDLADNTSSSSILRNQTVIEDIRDAGSEPLYNGTFYYDSSDNFENYLTELGVGYFLRKLALLAFPIITVTRHCPEEEGLNLTFTGSNCSWSIKTDAGLKNHVINFQTDEWVDDVTMDGRYIRSMFSTPDTNTLVEFQMEDSVNTTISRYFYSDRMEVRMNVNNVNASSLFKRNAT